MRWSSLLSVVIGLSIASGRLLSQETPGDQRPALPPAAPSLLRDTTAVHFQLILGRLQLDPVRYRKGTINRNWPAQSGDAWTSTQTLCVDAHRGIPTLHYFHHTPQGQVTIDVNERGTLRLQCVSTAGDQRIVLTQQTGRPITIEHIQAAQREELLAATWFHLYAAYPELYAQHLEPHLDDLLYPVRLSKLAEEAHTRSVAEITNRASDAGATTWPFAALPQIDNPTLHQWVAALGSTSRVARMEAHRQLHQQGISLLPRLQQIDASTLDGEQRERLDQLIRQLTPRSDDTEARVASLIRDDSTYWAAAAPRLSHQEQRLVAARLQSLESLPAISVAALPPIENPLHR